MLECSEILVIPQGCPVPKSAAKPVGASAGTSGGPLTPSPNVSGGDSIGP